MMRVDAHTHLDHYTEEQLPTALAEIDSLDVLSLANSMDLASYRRNLALAGAPRGFPPLDAPRIVVGLGVHPNRAAACVDHLDDYRPFLVAAPFFGEIGLDYHWVEDATTYPAQRAVFEFFLAAARDLDKPVNLHTKGAEAEILQLLDQYQIRRAIIHWYSGPLDIFRELVGRGYAFTIGVELPHSSLIRQFAHELPLSQLLTETDNPTGLEWLTGELGFPRHVGAVIAELARLRGVRVEEIEAAVDANIRRLLSWST